VAEKRRLPVLNNPKASPEDEAEPRAAWHWVGFGAVGVFVVWLPLAFLAQQAARRILEARVGSADDAARAAEAIAQLSAGERASLGFAAVAPQVAALAVACAVAGFLVGRFGDRAGKREAAASGLVAALVAVAVGGRGSVLEVFAMAVSVVALAVLSAFAGGVLGLRRRP
jgi:tRNA-(ms[2]io[6]A)-hydroxylase